MVGKFKKSIIAITCLVFVLTLSSVFAFLNQKENKVSQPSLKITETNAQVSEDSFSINWTKEENLIKPMNTIKAMNAVSPTATNGSGTGFSWSSEFDVSSGNPISAGTVITVSFSSTSITITLSDKGTITIQPTTGYKLTSLSSGLNSDVSKNIYVDSSTISDSATTEDLDPNYTGKIKFTVGAELITYYVDVYELINGTYSVINETDHTFSYNINGSSDVSGLNYYINTKKGSLSGDVCTIGTVKFKVDTSSSSIINIDWYKVKKVDESQSYGNFIDGNHQSASDPTLVKFEPKTYTVTINTGTAENLYWDDFNKTELYSVTTKQGSGKVTVNKNSSIRLASFKETAFSANTSISENDAYDLYNYGHYVSGYTINCVFADNTTAVYCVGDVGDLEGAVDFGNIDERTLGNVAAELDIKSIGKTISSITITPTWAPVTVNVLNSSTSVGSFAFASNYDLTDATNSPGQTYLCYRDNSVSVASLAAGSEKSLIADSGVWNYTNLTYSHSSGSTTYTINVEPVCLDNIYRVYLREIHPFIYNDTDETAQYNLDESCGFEFYNTSGGYNGKGFNVEEIAYSSKVINDYVYLTYDGCDSNGTVAGVQKYPLIEDYIDNALADYKSNWETGIAGSFDILNKVYYTKGTVSDLELTDAYETALVIYLANNQENANLPVFTHNNAQIIGYVDGKNKYYTTDNYSSSFENEFIDLTNGVNKFVFSENKFKFSGEDSVELTAKYVYALDLFYEDGSQTYGYNNLTQGWYGERTKLEGLGSVSPSSTPENKSFGEWMFSTVDAIKDEYSVTEQTEMGNVIKVSKSEFSEFYVYLTYRAKSSIPTKYNEVEYYDYYGISAVQGNGILNQTYKVEIGTTDEYNFYPLIKAKYKNTYTLTIDNDDTNKVDWQTLDNSNFDLYGVGVNGKATGATATMTISNNSDSAYPFQTNAGLAFYKNSEYPIDEINSKINSNYYYVYNYGYEILGWEINSNSTTFIFNGSTWSKDSSGYAYSNISTLTNVTLKDVAECIDDYFAGKKDVGLEITIKPIWTAATINVACEDCSEGFAATDLEFGLEYGDVDGNKLYNVDNNIPTGQSQFAYKWGENDENLIALSGVWNYRNIPHDKYVYKYVNDSSVYTITVNPVFVDNIYKVNLTNVKPTTVDGSNKVYNLGTCDYTYHSTTGGYTTGNDYPKYTFNGANSTGTVAYGYQPHSSSAYPLIDNYIPQLSTYKSNWEAGIAGSFDILRKVYYSDGTITADGTITNDKELTTTNVANENLKLFIYLANNQQTGTLPVFTKDYYTHIFWQNENPTDATKNEEDKKYYAYLTSLYDSDVHAEDLKLFEYHKEPDDNLDTFAYLWTLADGRDVDDNVSFKAHYFRDYVYVQIETLLEEEISRNGYVHISINDIVHSGDSTIDNEGGEYVAIAEYSASERKDVMKVYKLNSKEAVSLINTNSAENVAYLYRYDSSEGKLVANTNPLEITIGKGENSVKHTNLFKLYEGCDITINVKDQGEDSNAMARGYFDEMIGYKYAEKITQVNKILGLNEENADNKTWDYKNTSHATEIADKYATGTTVVIKVYFEKIKYELLFKMDDNKAGEFKLKNSTATVISNPYTSTTLKNMSVGTYYHVDYSSYAGYKLEKDAFVISNNNKVLQEYDENQYLEDGQTNGNYNISQQYILTKDFNGKQSLDGTWLREYFYSLVQTDYNVNECGLGTLTIQTEAIAFDYGYKVYDPTTGEAKDGYIIETVEALSGGLALGETGTLTTDALSGLFSPITENSSYYCYKDVNNDKQYALLNTRMFFPDNYLSKYENFFTTYSFLLDSAPTCQFAINSSTIAQMVEGYVSGTIIPVEKRTIYIMLEVRPLLEVTMQVEKMDNDANASTRTTYLTNANNNNVAITVDSGADGVLDGSKTFYKVNNPDNTSVTAYTYVGLVNNLSSVYEATYYSGVQYLLGTSPLEVNSFTLTEDVTITIKYQPKVLNVEYVYKLNGVEKDVDEIAPNYLTEIRPDETIVYSIKTKLIYSISNVHEDYNARITVNGTIKGSTNNTDRSVEIDDATNFYEITEADYAHGKIQVVVDVFDKENSAINVYYQLIDSSKYLSTDDYGTMSVFEGDALKAENVSKAENIKIIEARNVYVSINLKAGYEYKGIKKGLNSMQEIELVEDKILLDSAFDPNTDSGDYLIIINKVNITAKLDNDANNAQTGFVTTFENDSKTLENLYVGQTIKFKYTNTNKERLNYFFYYYNAPRKQEVEIEGEMGEYSITITSDLLSLYSNNIITFGAKTVLKYKLNFNIVGSEYLAENGFKVVNCDKYGKVTDVEYEMGSYLDVGSMLTFKAEPKNVGKFKVKLSGTKQFTYDGVMETEKEVDLFNFEDVIITLDSDCLYTLEIIPHEFSVNVQESWYESLAGLINKTPTDKTNVNDHINGLYSEGQNFLSTAKLTFVRTNEDRELTSLVISGNDLDLQEKVVENETYKLKEIVISFNGTTYTAQAKWVLGEEELLEDIDLENLANLGFALSIISNNERVLLTYTTQNDINLKFVYTDYRQIELS